MNGRVHAGIHLVGNGRRLQFHLELQCRCGLRRRYFVLTFAGPVSLHLHHSLLLLRLVVTLMLADRQRSSVEAAKQVAAVRAPIVDARPRAPLGRRRRVSARDWRRVPAGRVVSRTAELLVRRAIVVDVVGASPPTGVWLPEIQYVAARAALNRHRRTIRSLSTRQSFVFVGAFCSTQDVQRRRMDDVQYTTCSFRRLFRLILSQPSRIDGGTTVSWRARDWLQPTMGVSG